MSCPFKFKSTPFEYDSGRKLIPLKTETYEACRLQYNGLYYDICIGEDKCPIMKK